MRKIYFLLLLCCCVNAAMALPGFVPGDTHKERKHPFASDVIQPADVTACNGATTSPIVFSSSFPGTVFNWVNTNTSIGLASMGTGNIASFTAVNTTNAPVVATVTVIPTDGVSNGTPRSFTITVYPTPAVNAVASQTVCNNAATADVIFSGPVANATYSWTNSNPAIGLPASGTGNIPGFMATNNTTSPITSTITVTPYIGSSAPELLYYKFDGSGNSVPNLASTPPAGTANGTIQGHYAQGGNGICGGVLQSNMPFIFADYMDTHWSPNVTGSWTISFIAGGFSGTANGVEYAAFGNFNATTAFFGTYTAPQAGGNGLGIFTLYTNNNVVSVDGDFTVPQTVTFAYDQPSNRITAYLNGAALSASIGNFAINTPSFYIGNIANATLGSPTQGSYFDEFRLYNRLLSPTQIQALVNSCSSSGGSCAGASQTFHITVLPSPTVDAVANQSVCTNAMTAAIHFTGNMPGVTYHWTNDLPSIGLPSNGTGDIPSFQALNTTGVVQTANLTVTAMAPGMPACLSTVQTFEITVAPVPTVTASPLSQTYCSEGPMQHIIMSGNIPGATYNWTRDMLTEITGIPASGTGTISGFIANTTTLQATTTFTITPSFAGCVGNSITATVTLDPVPVATATPTSQAICAGAITDIVFSSNMSNTLFSWTRDNVVDVTGIPASGTGDITGSLTNNTSSPITVTFVISPSVNGCAGQPIFATVLVGGAPVITCPGDITTDNDAGACGAKITYTTSATGAPVPDLTYSFSGATTGSGTGDGSGSQFNVGVTTVTVTATNSCGSSTCSFNITVNDVESPTITCPSNIQANTDAGLCSASIATPAPAVADNCSIATQTWELSGATNAFSPLTGINDLGTYVFNKGTTTVTYKITDAAGHAVSCSYTVTVRDHENPVITCSPNITATTPVGSCTAIVNYTINATDNCPGVTTQLVSGPASGSAFPLGTTTVTWKATDAAGNTSANCSFTVTVLDGQLPVITTQPAIRRVCAGSNATFSVTASNVVSYQWQQWNGLAWINISGATASSYTIANTTVSMNASSFRVVLAGLCTTINSNAATLFVNPLPTITLSSTPRSSLLPGQETAITANVTPTGGTFNWTFNSNPLPGITGATVSPVSVEGIGVYSTVYTDPNGCVVASDNYTISGTPSDNMWVYPVPNNGLFEVRYYNQVNEAASVQVYNSNGQVVYQRSLVTRLAYSSIVVDLSNSTHTGVYVVKVISSTGKELAAKKIIIQR